MRREVFDGRDGRPHIYNRNLRPVTLGEVRAAIMRELRLLKDVYPLAQRAAAADKIIADKGFLRRHGGEYLGSVARCGFSEAFRYLPRLTGDNPKP